MTANEQQRYSLEARRFRDRMERRAYRIAVRYLRDWLTAAILNLGLIDWDELPESVVSEQSARSMLESMYNAVGPTSAKREFELVRSRIKLSLKRQNPLFDIGFFSRRWQLLMINLLTDQETARRVTNISETTRKQLRRLLAQAREQRLDVKATARLIETELGGKFLRNRALLIARTETTRAANVAAELGAAETSIKLEKVWIATADSRTRPAHRAMLGKKPIPKDSKFQVGGKQMKYPGDPAGGVENCANCRCIVSYVPVMVNGMPVAENTGSFVSRLVTGIGRVVAQSAFSAAIADLFKEEELEIKTK